MKSTGCSPELEVARKPGLGITVKVLQLAEVFHRQGKRLFLVGGSVRDALLHHASHDIDLATDASPDETKELARSVSPDGVYTIGERFGTVGLIFGGEKIEITTFRSESYDPKSRKPEVRFGTSLEEDLSRRDFTINAMAQDLLTGQLTDPYGGRDDLRERVIRAVGRAEERFAEDPLRLLRAVRLATQLGFTIHPTTWMALQQCAPDLARISRERVAEEMNRLLLAKRVDQGLRLLCQSGLMAFIIPELLAMKGVSQGNGQHKDILEHTLAVVKRIPSQLLLRWAAILHDIAKPKTIRWQDGQVSFVGHEQLGEKMARDILYRLRLDSKTVDTIAKLVGMHMRVNQYTSEWTDGAVRRFIREAGDEREALFALSCADITSHRPARVEAALARVAALHQRCQDLIAREKVEALKSPLDGHELMAMFGRPPGPWVGAVKAHLLALVLDGSLDPQDKERAATIAKEFVTHADRAT